VSTSTASVASNPHPSPSATQYFLMPTVTSTTAEAAPVSSIPVAVCNSEPLPLYLPGVSFEPIMTRSRKRKIDQISSTTGPSQTSNTSRPNYERCASRSRNPNDVSLVSDNKACSSSQAQSLVLGSTQKSTFKESRNKRRKMKNV